MNDEKKPKLKYVEGGFVMVPAEVGEGVQTAADGDPALELEQLSAEYDRMREACDTARKHADLSTSTLSALRALVIETRRHPTDLLENLHAMELRIDSALCRLPPRVNGVSHG